MKTYVSNRRLLKLAHILEKVPKENFHLRDWFSQKPECGFTACAIGHAAQDPGFKRIGFRLKKDEYGVLFPKFSSYVSWEAVSVFFGITLSEAVNLFALWKYSELNPGPRVVANRIREFVKNRK